MRQQFNGFTLIEVAIVMVIIGLILAAAITPLSKQIERNKIQQTQLILNDVIESLYGFAATNGYLPCPTNSTNQGRELRANNPPNNNCILLNGFVPAATLGLSGAYNEDTLLLDAWNNPIRYAVTQSDNGGNAGAFDFTAQPDPSQAPANPTEEIRRVGQSNLNPNLTICTLSGGVNGAGNCINGNTLAKNAVVIVLSLGKDGNDAISSAAVVGADQQENSSGVTLAAGPSGLQFLVSTDNVFVDHDYKETTTNDPPIGNGPFNDLIIWMPPYTLYNRMQTAGKLP